MQPAQQQVVAVIQKTLDAIVESLRDGQTIEFRKFGVFDVRERRQRVGRNPKTGQEVPILPRRVLVFRASNVLKSLINGTPGEEKG